MNRYAFIFIFSLYVLTACRSNRTVDGTMETRSDAETSLSKQTHDSIASQTIRRDSTTKITTEKQYIRTTWYRPDGTIQKIQEERRGARQDELAISHTGSSDVSVKETQSDSISKTKEQTREAEHEDNTTDTRPVQGIEWFWIAIAISLVAGIGLIAFFIYKKVKGKIKK